MEWGGHAARPLTPLPSSPLLSPPLPSVTLPVFVVFVWLCLFMDSEYWLSVPTFLLVAHLTNGYRQRRSGEFVRYWLQEASATTGTDRNTTHSDTF